MYSKDQLNVLVKLPLAIDFATIPGIKSSIQVFPKMKGLEDMYVVYVHTDQLDSVFATLKAHPEVKEVEKIPLRHLLQED